MFATVVTMDLAERIIDGTCLVPSMVNILTQNHFYIELITDTATVPSWIKNCTAHTVWSQMPHMLKKISLLSIQLIVRTAAHSASTGGQIRPRFVAGLFCKILKYVLKKKLQNFRACKKGQIHISKHNITKFWFNLMC